MSILVVDDSSTIRLIIKSILNEAGYKDLLFASSAREAFEMLGIDFQSRAAIQTGLKPDLILLDIVLPDLDGIEICRAVKSTEHLQDIPVLMVTGLSETETLKNAFMAGAMDYITKPLNKIELLVRIGSALKLKQEMDRRKAREQELLEITRELEKAIQKLNELSSMDGLTGVANRRRFEEYMESEWARGIRSVKPLSVIMVDIDFFKAYNDTYGHLAGDECLKAVAMGLKEMLKRPGDLICRYGGEEFAVILPETPKNGAVFLAEAMRAHVEVMGIPHQKSPISRFVTISLGVASAIPDRYSSPKELIAAADNALYSAKRQGRNRVCTARHRTD